MDLIRNNIFYHILYFYIIIITARLGAKWDLEAWTYDSDNSTHIQ